MKLAGSVWDSVLKLATQTPLEHSSFVGLSTSHRLRLFSVNFYIFSPHSQTQRTARKTRPAPDRRAAGIVLARGSSVGTRTVPEHGFGTPRGCMHARSIVRQSNSSKALQQSAIEARIKMRETV